MTGGIKQFYSKHRRSGMTIIEFLVVISLIGVLSTLVMISVNRAQMKARDAQRVHNISQIQRALERYSFDQNGVYPAVGQGAGKFSIGLPLTSPNGDITYMNEVPEFPKPLGEGACSDTEAPSHYDYAPLMDNKSYSIEYCVASNMTDIEAGVCFARPGMLCSRSDACSTTNTELDCCDTAVANIGSDEFSLCSGGIVYETNLDIGGNAYMLIATQENIVSNSWQNGMDFCEGLVANGKDDWYVPTLAELKELYEVRNSDKFTMNANGYYWSQEESGSDPSTYAWTLDFGTNNESEADKTIAHTVKCVRKQLKE